MTEQSFQILADHNREIYAYLYGFPNECPHCHKNIIPKFTNDYLAQSQYTLYATMICPNIDCDRPFIAQYERNGNVRYEYEMIVKYSTMTEDFPMEILEVSPKFKEIYNEAFFAEQNNLFEICGVGYRKALEFLIKDYLIVNFPDEKENIKKDTISNCIKKHVDDTKLKSTASRAIWLGNDHTHYEKKWNDKNLDDLKILIRLTINWIESEMLTKKFDDSMK